ncbi:hypothetical protein MJO28_010010 [Puccinia striiformis f. sp. tritici]|uniref:Uncharacterized protein n=1 Tax=Puccinia striiformis f. sp. tritici TaxID=168172 RepID=A0ACC0E994_9BASI|nr:hypothetical protein MJO28_010010 [Puccinia striiformis f. sp. tritici]
MISIDTLPNLDRDPSKSEDEQSGGWPGFATMGMTITDEVIPGWCSQSKKLFPLSAHCLYAPGSGSASRVRAPQGSSHADRARRALP